MKIEITPRKYIPLIKRFPNIEQLMTMKSGAIQALNGGDVKIAWDHRSTTLSFRDQEIELYSGDFKEALDRALDGVFVTLGKDVSFRFVEKVITPHENPMMDPREEKIMEINIHGERAFIVFDELMWWLRVT